MMYVNAQNLPGEKLPAGGYYYSFDIVLLTPAATSDRVARRKKYMFSTNKKHSIGMDHV
jgi:hypothetical protein